jgi:hypothetical protein
VPHLIGITPISNKIKINLVEPIHSSLTKIAYISVTMGLT